MKILICLVLLMSARACLARWQPIFEDIGKLIKIAVNGLHDIEERINEQNLLKLRSQYHNDFETGYLVCRIQEKYRMITEKILSVNEYGHKYPALFYAILLEEIEELYFDITHQVGMLHEIERKYNLGRTTTPAYTTVSRIMRKSTVKSSGAGSGGGGAAAGDDAAADGGAAAGAGEGRKPYVKPVKIKKKTTPFFMKDYFMRTTTTLPRSKQHWQLYHYGWEPEYMT